ncbi:MAG: PAS domain S-box protein [Candidatus Kapaibacterium sp.]
MRNELTVLILQDRSIGLESLQDDLRRFQLFPLFLYAATANELRDSLVRRNANVLLLVQQYFELTFEEVADAVRRAGKEIPIVVILPNGEEAEGMSLLKRGAQDYLLESELQRLAPTVYLALRERARGGTEENNRARRAAPTSAQATFELAASDKAPTAEALIGNLIDLVTEVDIKGTILYESPSITQQLGYTQEELIGRNAFTMIHPLDVPRVMPIFMVALASPGVPHAARFRFPHKNRSWRTLESVGKAIVTKDGARHVIVISRDVTDEARKPVTIGNTEARFMDVVEGLREGVLITDMSDKILYANKQMEEFIGYDATELLGKISYQLLLPKEAWPTYMEQKEHWLIGHREEYEISIPHKGGALLCMHVNISPYRDRDGRIVGTLAAFTDITKRKEGEEEVQRAFARLQVEKDRAEEMNRLKTSFLSNVSHEIRTPLNSILGFSSLLSEMLEGTDMGEYAMTIRSSGQRLFETIEGILDLSRVESNTVVLNPKLVSLETEARRAVASLESQAREKGVDIVVESPGPMNAMIDSHYMGRIFLNLIGNAIKFTQAGVVRVILAESNPSGYIQIKFADTGIGISEEFLPHLFEEFYQESSGLARKFEGTGLGLRIAKRLLELMGGTISVESEKGKGSCFTVRLPTNV